MLTSQHEAPQKVAVPVAYCALCLVWSSTWLVIKIGLRDLPPISFVALRFGIAIAVLFAVSIGRCDFYPRDAAITCCSR